MRKLNTRTLPERRAATVPTEDGVAGKTRAGRWPRSVIEKRPTAARRLRVRGLSAYDKEGRGGTPKPSRHLSDAVVHSLYETAASLDRRWASAGLPVGFHDRMIDAVVRFVSRNPSADFGPEKAKRLLISFWYRNARRDAARSKGRLPLRVEFHEELLSTPVINLESHDLFETCRTILRKAGERSILVEAFLEDIVGKNAQEIADSMRRSGKSVSAAAIRQWKCRGHFLRILNLLRANQANLANEI